MTPAADLALRIVDDRGRWLSIPANREEALAIVRLYPPPPGGVAREAIADALLAFYGVEDDEEEDLDELEMPG